MFLFDINTSGYFFQRFKIHKFVFVRLLFKLYYLSNRLQDAFFDKFKGVYLTIILLNR